MTYRPVGLGILILLIPACAQTPKTQGLDARWPVVDWERLCDTDVARASNGYQLVEPSGTTGLFPCSLGVARITVPPSESPDQGPATVLAMSPQNELIDWLALFDDAWYIATVFPITLAGDGRHPVDARTLTERAGRAGAGLCLVYGLSDDGPTHTEVRGVIYDARNNAPLATVHADARIDPAAIDDPPPGRHENDRRHADPRFVAQARFLERVKTGVVELKNLDTPGSPKPPPTGWVPEGPFAPPVWPPAGRR